MQVSAGSGDVTGENLAARTEVTTASGSIRLSYLGGEAVIRNSSGGVTIREAKHSLRVRASSGDVAIESVLTPGALWDVETASGDVDLKLPPQSQFEVDGESRGGGVHADFPLQITDKESKRGILRGSVGQSDSRLRLRSHSGRIRLRKI